MNKYEKFWQEVLILLNSGLDNKNLIFDKICKLIKNQFNEDILIEFSNNNDLTEIIFCGGHDKNKLNIIKNIISFKPIVKNFDFIGPKPGFGFDFTINIDNQSVDAFNMLFYPLKKEGNNELGISLYLKGFEDIKNDILWKIIETGIGEEKSSKISHLSYMKDYDEESLDIKLLEDYVDWYLNKKNI